MRQFGEEERWAWRNYTGGKSLTGVLPSARMAGVLTSEVANDIFIKKARVFF
jgi:hypothetical protein